MDEKLEHPAREQAPALGKGPVPAWGGVALCLLLAVAQMAYCGYRLGAGNQPIQIAFLKHWADPSLFTADEMVRQTMPLYPSYFFRLIAPLARFSGVEPLYLMLQMLTAFLTLSGVYLLSRSIFRSHAAALVAAGLLVAGHHRALAAEYVYTAFFTHTLAALPLALWALALAYRRQIIPALAVAGILFNLHALTAAYAVLMIGFAGFADLSRATWKRWLLTWGLGGAAFFALASPTLYQMATQHQVFDATWLNLMRVRSSDHSFPDTWWETGNTDLPRYALIAALFVLSWSFSPVRHAAADRARALKMTVWMTVAVGLLFAAGYVFSEIWPVATVVRLQPFRASRLMLILMFVHIAYGAVEGLRAGVKGWASGGERQEGAGVHERVELGVAARIMEIAAGVLVLVTLGVPTLLPLLPLALVGVLAAALVSGRLSAIQVGVAVAALTLAALAWRQIAFEVPLLSQSASLLPRQWNLDWMMLGALGATVVFALAMAVVRWPIARALVLAGSLAVGSVLAWQVFHREISDSSSAGTLRGVSNWARTSTPRETIFLAPTITPGISAFRVFAERGLVADWRDGTQLYFAGAFGPEWLARLTAVEPGLALSPDGRRLVARGRELASLDDDELIELTKKYHAAYVLLPTPAKDRPRALQVAYADERFTAYLPKILTAIPEGVVNPAEWRAVEKFMATTVAQNIEKHRKAQVTVQIVDAAGHPVQDLMLKLEQTDHLFKFGASLSFLQANSVEKFSDQRPPVMTEAELKLIPTVFNASMIPFSSKWMCIEPADGKRNFDELDRYVEYCRRNNLAIEYHFLSGLLPTWLQKNNKLAIERFPAHAREIVERYHDKVEYWQVQNDGYLLHQTPPLFKEFREKYPGIKLGASDCTKFHSDSKDPKKREASMYKGLNDLIWLKQQGIKVDFFSMHGHSPPNLWADPRTMYEVFDRFAKEGVKVHVTEALVPLNSDLVGGLRKGKWTLELQAEYLERFMTVCFSHPDVELVNLWGIGPKGWGASGGLVDEKMNPRLAFERLKKLLKETWHTRLETQLPLDGIVTTRAFHGDYALIVKLPDGREVRATLKVPQAEKAGFKFRLDSQRGVLELQP